MDKMKQILESWKQNASTPVTEHSVGVHLPLHDLARIQALADIFPGRTQQQIITDLLSAALDEIEATLPYIKGTRVVAEDEFGDPIFEDIGPTPQFEAASHKHYTELMQSREKKHRNDGINY